MVKRNDVFDQQIGFMMWDTERRIAREFAARSALHGIASGLVPFLRVLEWNDRLTQSELAEKVSMRGSTTAKAVKELELLGLVERRLSSTDGRKNFVKLTEAGRQICRQLGPEAELLNRRLLSGFDRREEALLREFLKRMRTNLENPERQTTKIAGGSKNAGDRRTTARR